MYHLTIVLFGHPQFFIDGTEVRGFNTRKDCALLAYLAATGSTHSREHLAELLWSDLPEANARRNLRHTLSHLHKVIGPAWLETEGGVALTQSLPWAVDVQRLQAAVSGLAPQSSRELRQREPGSVDALEHALNGYRGEFLQEFHVQKAAHFDEWMLARREEYHLLALYALEVVAQQDLVQGNYVKGLAATRRLLQLEPWSETAHALQMQLLMGSGQRTAALAQYEACRQLLAAELGVEPMPETTTLYQQMQAGSYNAPVVHQRLVLPFPPSLAPPAHAPLDVNPAVPHNLLIPLAGFVGRQSELDLISRRLGAPDCRLLTIVGPGGMGKTALSQAAGQRLLRASPADFPDGIFFVPLLDVGASDSGRADQALADDLVSGEALLQAIAAQIGYKLAGGIASAMQLGAYLRTRRLLLILDNFEHLLADSGALVTLLSKAPHLKALVTSRARLNVRGESVLTLNQLSLPTVAYHAAVAVAQADTARGILDDAWQISEAMTMFVQRAQQLDPFFTINAETIRPVGQICQLVEGLPLGIELATSMLPMYSCSLLAAALAKGLDFLTADMRDLPKDQRTLVAVFERSWRLLPPEGQLLLARLSIFPGSFHRDAAERIAGASGSLLRRLLDQSLLSSIGGERYVMHRTIHAFAQQKLQGWPEQIEMLHPQYAHFYLDFVARQETGLTGAEYALVTQQIQADLDNVRTAWRRAVACRMATELNRCLHALYLFYEQQRSYLEAIDLYTDALHRFSSRQTNQGDQVDAETNLLVGRLQTFFGLWNARVGRFQQAQAAYESSWSALQRSDNPAAAALCLGFWGGVIRRSDPKRAAALLTEALHLIQGTNEVWMKVLGYQLLGDINLLFGNYEDAVAQITKGYFLAKQLAWARGLTSAHKSLGLVNLSLGQYHQAEAHLREGIEFSRQHHLNVLCQESMAVLGGALRLQGRLAEAKSCFVESRALAEALGAGLLVAPVLWEEGCLAEQCGDYRAAKALFHEGLAIGLPPWWSHALPTLGWALIGLGELAEAQVHFQQVLTDAEAQERLPISLDAQAGLAYIQAFRARHPSQASQILLGESARTLHDVYQHPAATAETRQRIVKIAEEFGLRLREEAALARSAVSGSY